MDKIHAKKYLEATSLLDSLLLENPQDEEFLLLKAYCLFYERRYADGIATLNLILEINPKSSRAFRLLAYYYGQDKKYYEALDSINNSIRLDSTSIESYKIKASLLRRMDYLSECILCINEGIRIDSKNWELHYLLAGAMVRNKNFGLAFLEYKNAYKYNPSYLTFSALFLCVVWRYWYLIYPSFLILVMLSLRFRSPLFLLPIILTYGINMGENLRQKKRKNSIVLLVIVLLLFLLGLRIFLVNH